MNYFKELQDKNNLGKMTVTVELNDGTKLKSEKLVPYTFKEKAKGLDWESKNTNKGVKFEEVKGNVQDFGNKLERNDISIPIIEEFNKCDLSHDEEVFILLIQRDREGLTKGYNHYKEKVSKR